MTPRNLPESVLHFQSFCFAYFLVSIVVVNALSSLVALSLKTILDMRRYRRFDGKRAKKSKSAATHTNLTESRQDCHQLFTGETEGTHKPLTINLYARLGK